MNELVKIDPKEYGLEEKQASEITKGLSTILEERSVLIDSYKETITLEITEENLPAFKSLRLQIVRNRTQGLKVWHKTNKAYFLAGGNFVQAIYNKEVAENERMESQLMEAEKHFENLEKERVEKLTLERFGACVPYVEDVSLIVPDLGTMPQSLWDNYLIGLKSSYEARIAAEKKAEEERIAAAKAEEARQKAIEEENARLKAEAEAAAKKQEEERLERERLAKIEADKLAKEEAKRKAEADKKQREYEAKIEAERKEKERIQKELEAKAEAERLAIEKAKKAEQAELNKGDAAKVKDLIADLEALKTKYSFKSEKNKKMYNNVSDLLDKVINYI
jgi:hypothetical protein